MTKQGSVLVIFTKDSVSNFYHTEKKYDVVVSDESIRHQVEKLGHTWMSLEGMIDPGSIYEATSFVEELSRLSLSDGSRLTKLFLYKNYELWWSHYNTLFLFCALPYTQYKKLLSFLKNYEDVYFFEHSYKTLFYSYLTAYGSHVHVLKKSGVRSFTSLPFGVFVQILLTLIFIPILFFRRPKHLVFVGDKFEKGKDYDFRMRFVYPELRRKNMSFVECIRSLESWRVVLQHAFVRRRPVIYSEAVIYMGRFLSFITGGNVRAKQKFGAHIVSSELNPENRFKLLIALEPLRRVYEDVWSIRIMKCILRLIGIRSALFTAALERNFHVVFGCKLNAIPTVGILHGVSSRFYNAYDFMPGFEGDNPLALDKYGVWSAWWKEYYEQYSKAYRKDQIVVSGPMRPTIIRADGEVRHNQITNTPVKVLFISEQLAVPQEIIPYLENLLDDPDIKLTFSFRQYRDGFRDWLQKNRPDILQRKNVKISELGLQDAIKDSEVTVGTHSTAVLEALFEYRVPVFFETKKWGDYFNLKEYKENHPFYAQDIKGFIERVKGARLITKDALKELLERFFGDPSKNGSAWAVDEIEKFVRK